MKKLSVIYFILNILISPQGFSSPQDFTEIALGSNPQTYRKIFSNGWNHSQIDKAYEIEIKGLTGISKEKITLDYCGYSGNFLSRNKGVSFLAILDALDNNYDFSNKHFEGIIKDINVYGKIQTICQKILTTSEPLNEFQNISNPLKNQFLAISHSLNSIKSPTPMSPMYKLGLGTIAVTGIVSVGLTIDANYHISEHICHHH